MRRAFLVGSGLTNTKSSSRASSDFCIRRVERRVRGTGDAAAVAVTEEPWKELTDRGVLNA